MSLALLETLRQALGDADVIPSHHPARASPLYRAIQATVDLGQHVIADYQHYLGRTPAPSEVAYWVGLFVQGQANNETVAAGFLSSAEYFQSAHKGQGDRADWIRSVYYDTLRRSASDAEVAYWVGGLT